MASAVPLITTIHGPHGGILWILGSKDHQTVKLPGMCRYWIEGNQFGGFHCPEHPLVGISSFRWNGSEWVGENKAPTLNVPVLEGEWMTDDEWQVIVG